MALKIGLVGLPNVGKSTLFNALLKKQQAYVANFPFATIEPNVGVVPVPDDRLDKLAEVIGEQSTVNGVKTLPPKVPATVEFVDIAGLIEGASKGEGLGNKFLNHIRQVDAICFVLRAFSDPDVIRQGVVAPKEDLGILKLELDLADEDMIEKHKLKKNADVESLPLFKDKPLLVCLNIDESEVVRSEEIANSYAKELDIDENQIVVVCAKIEAELASLSDNEQKEYLDTIGAKFSALDNLIQKAFKTLGLITFLTAGEKEVRAWTIRLGFTSLMASGVIHTDFMAKFIKADVCDFNAFIECKGWKVCRELGKVRSEGRDYVVKDGDVIEFKIGS